MVSCVKKVHTATAILKLRLRATLDFGTFLAPLLHLHLLANTLPCAYHEWICGAKIRFTPPKIYRALSPDVAPYNDAPLVRYAFQQNTHLGNTNHGQTVGMDRAYMVLVTDEHSP